MSAVIVRGAWVDNDDDATLDARRVDGIRRVP